MQFFPFSLIPSFPFVSSISNLCLESQKSYSVKAVCSTHHWRLYRSSARQWWFVPVLRQNYPLPLSQYRLLPLSGAFPRADAKKERRRKHGGGKDEGISFNRCVNCWWDLSDNLVSNCHCQSLRHRHVWFPSCGAKLSEVQCAVRGQYSMDFQEVQSPSRHFYWYSWWGIK